MKFLAWACLVLLPLPVSAADLTVTDVEGRAFYLFVGGVAQSNQPLPRYQLHYLPAGRLELRIEIPYARLGSFRQVIFCTDGQASHYQIELHPLGNHLWLRQLQEASLKGRATSATTSSPAGDAWLQHQEALRQRSFQERLAERRRQAEAEALVRAERDQRAPEVAAAPQSPAGDRPHATPANRESFWDRLRRRREERAAERRAQRLRRQRAS